MLVKCSVALHRLYCEKLLIQTIVYSPLRALIVSTEPRFDVEDVLNLYVSRL